MEAPRQYQLLSLQWKYPTLPLPPLIPKFPPLEGRAVAAVAVRGEEGEGEAVGEETTATRPTIIIEIKIKIKAHRIILQVQVKSLIKKAQSMLTFLQVHRGPVHSTGRKAEVHPTAVTLWSVSGLRS